MIKLKIIGFVLLLIVSNSCVKEKNKQEIENSKTEQYAVDEVNDSLINNESSSKLDENNSDLDKEGFFTYILNKLNLNEYVVTQALYDVNLFGSSSNNYIISSFNRSSENIENFFGDKEIDFIVRLLKVNDIYYKSGSDLMVKGLLETYKELKDDEHFLNRVFDDNENSYDLLQEKFSDKVKHLIDFDKYQLYENGSQIENRLFMVYSFWVRRHHEGNSKIVYDLLKKLDSKMEDRYNGNALDFDREQVISKISSDEFTAFNFDTDVFNFLFDEMEVASKQFEYFIADCSIFIPRTEEDRVFMSEFDEEYKEDGFKAIINRLYSNFDRSPENIHKILNDNMLNHIAFLFNYKVLVKDQKLYKVLKGLLLTYDEMDDIECERLYNILSENSINAHIKVSESFKDKTSDKVKEFVTIDGYFEPNENNDDYGYGKRTFYLYSFWARRYNENNKEAVYEILKKLDAKIK